MKSEATGPRQFGTIEEILGSAQVREQHRALLLRLLWRARETSRADLARKTGLSRSTISAIVADLLEGGLVEETHAGVSSGGRKPIVLTFCDDAHVLVGVDMGATHIGVVVTNLRAQVKGWAARPFPVRTKPLGALALIQELIDEALAQAKAPKAKVLGIGVGVPSPVHPDHPGQLLPLILPKWADVDLLDALQKMYGLPVFVDNDANLGALAEAWWGEGRHANNLAFIKVAYGVGSGLIIDGRIHRGQDGTAGEIGHTSLDPNGPQCVCGLRGCINTLIGTQRLLELVVERAPKFPNSSLAGRKRPGLEHLVAGARERDPLALEIMAHVGRVLGTAIANLLNLLAPEVVVLGGGLTEAGDALLAPILETVRATSLARPGAQTPIQVSTLGIQGIALGAATLALEAALDDPRVFESRQRLGA